MNDPAALPAKKKFDPKVALKVAWLIVRRRFILLGMAVGLAGAVGVVGSGPMTVHTWQSSGVLLHASPPIPDSLEGVRNALSLTNVGTFIASKPVLQQLCHEFNCPLDVLELSLTTEQSRNAATVFISLKWGDRDECLQMVTRLMEIYPQYVAKVRRSVAQARLDECEQQLEETQQRLDAARRRHRDFSRKHNIVDIKGDLVLTQTEISSLEAQLRELTRNDRALRDQIGVLDKQVVQIREEQEAGDAESKKFEAAEETLADNRRRQNRLRELIQEERLLIDVRAQLEAKRAEYERAKRLSDRQFIPRSRVEKLRAEMESLISKINENEKITQWKKELTELDKTVVPVKGKNRKTGSPIIHQILFTKLQTELKILHGERSRLEIEEDLEQRRTKVATFQRLRGDMEALTDAVTSISDERQKIDAIASVLRQLVAYGPIEFSIASPATIGDQPVKSNRKKAFLGLVVGVMFFLGPMILGYDIWRCGLLPTDIKLKMLGIDRVAQLPLGPRTTKRKKPKKKHLEAEAAREVAVAEQVRHLALLMRQTLREPGAVVMISHIARDVGGPNWIRHMLECLAARDERVMLVDARCTEEGIGSLSELLTRPTVEPDGAIEGDRQPGLHDWLAFRADLLDQIVVPTTIHGVECILAGNTPFCMELGTMRLTQLMEELRETYSIVIVLGPNSNRATDVQIIASHANGILLPYHLKDRMNKLSTTTLETLVGIDAPIIGSVEY